MTHPENTDEFGPAVQNCVLSAAQIFLSLDPEPTISVGPDYKPMISAVTPFDAALEATLRLPPTQLGEILGELATSDKSWDFQPENVFSGTENTPKAVFRSLLVDLVGTEMYALPGVEAQARHNMEIAAVWESNPPENL